MKTLIHERVELARAARNPYVICRVRSGWVVLGDQQFLRGCALLLADPVVGDLNDLVLPQRAQFLTDMAAVGDALLAETTAYRVNYEILGNTDPALHAHIHPRYLNEPEQARCGPVWLYDRERRNSVPFDPVRDRPLMVAIRRHLETNGIAQPTSAGVVAPAPRQRSDVRSKMKIRKANENDVVAIGALLSQLGYADTAAFLPRRFKELAGDHEEELVVAEESSGVVGVLSLHFIPQLAVNGPFARISYLVVRDDHRNKGIGRQLEEYAESVSRAKGCDRIELHCHSRRHDAHRFYFRQGYEESPKYLMKKLK